MHEWKEAQLEWNNLLINPEMRTIKSRFHHDMSRMKYSVENNLSESVRPTQTSTLLCADAAVPLFSDMAAAIIKKNRGYVRPFQMLLLVVSLLSLFSFSLFFLFPLNYVD